MNIILTEIKCQECGIKLTEYEIKEKDSHCMECYEDESKTH